MLRSFRWGLLKCLEIKDTLLKKYLEEKAASGKGLLSVVNSVVVFYYKDLSVFREQVQEGREKEKIPEREGCQALVEARSTHFKVIRQAVFLNDQLMDCM